MDATMPRYHLTECLDRGEDVPRESRFGARITREDGGEICLRAFPSQQAAQEWADRAAEHLERERLDRMATPPWNAVGIHQ